MNTKVYKLLVAANQTDGNGTATTGNVLSKTNPGDGVVGILTNKNNVMDSSPTYAEAIAEGPSIFIARGVSGYFPHKSSPIQLSNVKGAYLSLYAPTARQTTVVGYNRVTSTGSLEANAAGTTTKEFALTGVFKGNKNTYSGRQEFRRWSYVAAAGASQRTVAIGLANRINSDPMGLATAIVVGDGTGQTLSTSTTPYIQGDTGATNYGIEITSQGLESYKNYMIPFMQYFTISAPTGFTSATAISTVQEHVEGNGTKELVTELETNEKGWSGLTNRRLFPIPTYTSYVNTSGTALAMTPTATVVQNNDKVTFSATVAAILLPGDKITINGEACEIKYFISTTVAVLTAPVVQTGAGTLTTTRTVFYNLLVIEHDDVHTGGVLMQDQAAKQMTIVALPYNAAANGTRTAHPIEADLTAILTGAPIGLTALPVVTMDDGN